MLLHFSFSKGMVFGENRRYIKGLHHFDPQAFGENLVMKVPRSLLEIYPGLVTVMSIFLTFCICFIA